MSAVVIEGGVDVAEEALVALGIGTPTTDDLGCKRRDLCRRRRCAFVVVGLAGDQQPEPVDAWTIVSRDEARSV